MIILLKKQYGIGNINSTDEILRIETGLGPSGIKRQKTMKIYTFQAAEKLIQKYSELENSQVIQTDEGSLGIGDWICTAPGKKTAIIKEVFLNEWSSGQTIKLYNKTPKKYIEILNS